MPRTLLRTLCALFVIGLFAGSAHAQSAPPEARPKSGGKAFLLNLVVPGLGQRYLNDGRWTRGAVLFAAVDAGLWAGLLGANWRSDHLEKSYTTLAAGGAGALVEGKNRAFFLNLARFRSSDAYVDALLRSRNWGQLTAAEDPANAWAWATSADWARYRALREDAEALRRQRPLLISLLVANRLLSGIGALRTARRMAEDRAGVAASLGPPPFAGASPQLNLRLRF